MLEREYSNIRARSAGETVALQWNCRGQWKAAAKSPLADSRECCAISNPVFVAWNHHQDIGSLDFSTRRPRSEGKDFPS